MAEQQIEIRSISSNLQASNDDKFQLSGVAASFNTPSSPIPERGGAFIETIAPGAFKRALAEKQDVRCLFNHSANVVLGRTASGTLALTETDRGLAFLCQLDKENTEHRNIYSSIRRGDVNQMSFGFLAKKDSWDSTTDERGRYFPKRTLLDVDLFEVSVLGGQPAYPTGTSVDARSAVNYFIPKDLATPTPMDIRALRAIDDANRRELDRLGREVRADLMKIRDEEFRNATHYYFDKERGMNFVDYQAQSECTICSNDLMTVDEKRAAHRVMNELREMKR